MWPRRASPLLLACGALTLAALAALGPRPAWSQEGWEEPQRFKLRSIDGYLGTGFEFEETINRRTGRQEDRKETERDIFGELKLEPTISIYHPRFLLIKGHVVVRLEEGERELSPDTGLTGAEDELVNEYDLNLALLPKHPYNLRVFGNRSTQEVGYDFFPDFNITNEHVGAHLAWRHELFPMWLDALQRESRGTGANTIDEESRSLTYNVGQITKQRHSRFQYKLEDFEDRRSKTDRTSNYATLDNTMSFGKDGRSLLSNYLTFLYEEGTIPRNDFYGTSTLRLYHGPTFETHYRYGLQRREEVMERIVRHDGDMGFQHRLYRNLTTTADVGGNVEDGTNMDSWETRSSINFDYVRSTSFGSVTVGAGGQFRLIDNDFVGDVGKVSDESHTFDVNNTLRLSNEDVRTNTIFVTDESTGTVYVENVDYLVRLLDSSTELVRLLGGIIPPGGSVAVDYEFDILSDQRFYTIGRDVRIGLNLFQEVSLYTSFRRQDRNLVEGIDPGGEDDIDVWIAGVSFSRGGFRARLEHEEYDSELFPRLINRADWGVNLRLPFRARVGASASWSRTTYPNARLFTSGFQSRGDSEVVGLRGSVTFNPIRSLYIEGGASFREETGRVESLENVFFGRARLHIRQLEIKIKAERRREEDRTGEDFDILFERDRDFFEAEVIRRF